MATIVQRRKQLRAEARQRQTETVPRLKAAVRRARRVRAERLKDARLKCALEAAKIRREAAAARAALRAWSLETKDKARAACRLLKENVRAEALEEIDAALKAVEVQRAEIQRLRRQAVGMRDPRGQAGGKRAAELRAEALDEARRNLGDDPIVRATFERIKHRLRPTPYRSLSEAYFEYVHDHPEALQETGQRLEAQWEAEANRLIGRLAKLPPDEAELPGYLADLDEADRHLLDAPPGAAHAPF